FTFWPCASWPFARTSSRRACRASVQIRRLPKIAEAQLPVVREHRRQWLDEVHEVRVRGLEVLDDGPELLALARSEDARDLDVEGVAGEAVGGAEHPVDAEQRLAQVERVGVEGRDGRD